jgi:hypothetical protein
MQLFKRNQFQSLEKCGIRFVFDVVKNFRLIFSSLKIILGLCKKMLEITTVAEHDGDIYCKQCYTRKFGIRGVGFGLGAGALGMDTGERFGNTQSQLYVYFILGIYTVIFSFRNKLNYPPMPNLPPS